MKPALYGFAILNNHLIIWGRDIEKFVTMSDVNGLKIGVPDADWILGVTYPIEVKSGDFFERVGTPPHYESVIKREGQFTLEEILKST